MGKRDDILQATLDIVVDEGVAAFSFAKLFERAGVGAGTVYHYFAGKDALLEALFTQVAARFDAEVSREWSQTQPIRAQFDGLLRSFAVYAMANPKDVIFLETCSRTPSIPRDLRERVTPGERLGMQVIAQAQAEGLMRPMHTHLALAVVSGMVGSVVASALSHKYPLGATELDTVLDAAWRALATDVGLKMLR